MIDQELLRIVVCPETHARLALADVALINRINDSIAQGKITNRAGQTLSTRLGGGLVRDDQRVLYPILDDIPMLLVDEAIPLDQLQTVS